MMFLLGWQAQKPVRVDFLSPDEVCLCIAAPLPKLGHKDLELLQVGLKTLVKGSQEYSPMTIRQITVGRGIVCKLLGDSALVSVTVPKGATDSGIALLASLMVSPTMNQDDLDKSLGTLNPNSSDYWSNAMHPDRFDLGGAPHDEVVAVFQRVFRPDRAIMAFGGAVGQTPVASTWMDRTAEWTAVKEPRFPDESKSKPILEEPGPVTVTELIGKDFPATDPRFAARVFALYALGSGKGSSLFRIARERRAWSYRQEAYLWPTIAGWEPRLFVPMIAAPDAAMRVQTLQQELETDIGNWTEADRQRAIGMAEATLLRDEPYGPLILGDSPIGNTLQDQVEMAAYWRMKTKSDWDPQVLFQQISKVDLAALKAAAGETLADARQIVIPGRG